MRAVLDPSRLKRIAVCDSSSQRTLTLCLPSVQSMWSNVILCGGTSLHIGLMERVNFELSLMAPRVGGCYMGH